MEQPPRFVARGEFGNKVCRLRKSSYGLKQSPRAWFGKFSAAVIEFGLQRSTCDNTMFFRQTDSGYIVLIVCVDDIVITGSDRQGKTKFQIKDLGTLKYFLGIEVIRSKKGIFLSQRKYVLDLHEEVGMLGVKPCDTPMDPNVKLVAGEGEMLEDPERYQILVGKLNYLVVTHPDIAFPVSVVSRFMAAPTITH